MITINESTLKEFFDETRRKLNALSGIGSSLEGLASNPELRRVIGQESEATINRQDYVDLSDARTAQKRKLKLDPRILIAFGGMLEGLKTGNSFDMQLTNIGNIDVVITDPIAGYHQTGTRRGLPDRQVIEATPKLAEEIGKLQGEAIAIEIVNKLKKV